MRGTGCGCQAGAGPQVRSRLHSLPDALLPGHPFPRASCLPVLHMADRVVLVTSSARYNVFAATRSWAWPMCSGVAYARSLVCMQGKYGNLDASVISYGPCQTPTLAFCVQRHQVMTAFQPEDSWSVRPHISKAGQRCELPLGPKLSICRAHVTPLTCALLPEPSLVQSTLIRVQH